MPTGEKITSERFSEFENAYNILKNTEKFENEIKDLREKENTFEENIFIITEGKSDWKYIIAALKYFHGKDEFQNIEEKYFFKHGTKKDVDTKICGTKIEVEMGDEKLKKYLSDKNNDILKDSKRLVIGIFDSDNDNIKIINNECLGIYSFKIEPSGISTEYLFEDEDLFKEVDGRKLYSGENFSKKSGRFNDLNLGINSMKKAGKKIIIDDCVFDCSDENIALTKDRFATAIFNNEITISSKSFENFKHIFEKIKQIIDGYNKKMEG